MAWYILCVRLGYSRSFNGMVYIMCKTCIRHICTLKYGQFTVTMFLSTFVIYLDDLLTMNLFVSVFLD